MTLKESAKKLGVMTQMNSFSFDFTVFEVVMMGRTPHKKLLERDSNEDFNIAIEAINQVGLEKFINRKFNSLSGGEKQRVMIARAITSQPKALILDEPTNHLDIHYQITLLEIVKNLGISIFSAMHDLNLAAAFCHKIYVMKEGKVVACGKPDEILTPSLIRDVFEVNAVINRVDETGAVNIVYISV
jgi:iron complex transport system ATP-binding protein